MTTPKRRKRWIFILAAIVVVGGLVVFALANRKPPATTVQTEKVSRRNITEIVVANGKIQPVKQVVISPEVAGEIVKLPEFTLG